MNEYYSMEQVLWGMILLAIIVIPAIMITGIVFS